MARYANKRIGILGGTFNPVHNGHTHIAGYALKKLRLDKIVFIPAYIPPHKKICGNAKTSDRLRMLKAATKGRKKFIVSTYEIGKKGKSYSIRTARHFKKRYSRGAELFFIIGSDSLRGIGKWKDLEALERLVQFVVVPRSGFGRLKEREGYTFLRVPKKNISSTEIRRRVKKGEPIRSLVPRVVARHIKRKKLYHA
ncbi:nicotinate-nucleotide adenylyltransferase [Candidatus Omnitrophota bacterium]